MTNLGKAKKRVVREESQVEEPRIESTGIYRQTKLKATNTTGIEQVLKQISQHRNRNMATWLDTCEKAMTEAIQAQDLFPGQRDDARIAMGHIKAIRHHIERQEAETAAYEAFQLGLTVERFSVRGWEAPAAEGHTTMVYWHDRWIKVKPDYKTVLLYMRERSKAPLEPLYRKLYGKRITAENRMQFDTFLTRLNAYLYEKGIQRVRFGIGGKLEYIQKTDLT